LGLDLFIKLHASASLVAIPEKSYKFLLDADFLLLSGFVLLGLLWIDKTPAAESALIVYLEQELSSLRSNSSRFFRVVGVNKSYSNAFKWSSSCSSL